MQRIAVIGTSGTGKTTLAKALSERLGVPWVELDSLFHGPGWTEPDADEFRTAVAEATAGDGWVVDGNYESRLGELVVGRADTIVWLDLPKRVFVPRLLGRTYRRWRTQEELWNGNRESFRAAFWGRDSLLWWALGRHGHHRREAPKRLAGRNVVRLRSQAEVDRFLRGAGVSGSEPQSSVRRPS